jgi:hypothetical protein
MAIETPAIFRLNNGRAGSQMGSAAYVAAHEEEGVMTLHLYTALRAWPLARQARKGDTAPARPAGAVEALQAEEANAVIYAAGIACAGQVAERTERPSA